MKAKKTIRKLPKISRKLAHFQRELYNMQKRLTTMISEVTEAEMFIMQKRLTTMISEVTEAEMFQAAYLSHMEVFHTPEIAALDAESACRSPMENDTEISGDPGDIGRQIELPDCRLLDKRDRWLP